VVPSQYRFTSPKSMVPNWFAEGPTAITKFSGLRSLWM
jgi:hypothetical protein